jgi:hypothetical protein
VKASKQPRRGHLSTALAIVAGVLGVCAAAPAFAVLGGDPLTAPDGATSTNATVHAAVAASGASAATATSTYTVHSITLASGTIVNEYVSTAGTVFGIGWSGPRVPNLPTLLGSYFTQYQQGVTAERAARGGRGPVNVQGSGLVVQSGGHMGAFTGRAYLPDALPAGVSASDIQ